MRHAQKLTDQYVDQLKEDGDSLTARSTGARVFLIAAMAVCILAGLISGFFIERGIDRPLEGILKSMSTAASNIAASSKEVARGGQSLAEGASEQAASLEETAVTGIRRRGSAGLAKSVTFAGFDS